MRNETTFLKISSLILGLFVLFFTTILKVENTSLISFVSDDVLGEERVKEVDRVCYVVDPVDEVFKSNAYIQESVFGETQKSAMHSLFLIDFDDLEYTFIALSILSKRAFFFQDVVKSYTFMAYKKVKLFLFYSFIKIPTVFL